MSNIIPITTKVTKKMKPPVRKSEMVEALAFRLVDKHRELNQAARIVAEDANKALDAACLEIARQSPIPKMMKASVESRQTYEKGECVYRVIGVEVKYVIEDSRIAALAAKKEKAWEAYRAIHVPIFAEAKRSVRDKLDDKQTSNERVAAMLSDPATIRKLDEILTDMSKPKQIAIAG